MSNDLAIIKKTAHIASHRKGHITLVKAITVKGLQMTALVTGLIT